MEDTPHPARSKQLRARLRDWPREGRHGMNARYGLTCCGREGDDRLWGPWRDERDARFIDWAHPARDAG
jgi:hypothetical protein